MSHCILETQVHQGLLSPMGSHEQAALQKCVRHRGWIRHRTQHTFERWL